MQRLEVSCAVRHIYIYMSLGVKGLKKRCGRMDWISFECRNALQGFIN